MRLTPRFLRCELPHRAQLVAETVGRCRAGRVLVMQRLDGMRKVRIVRPEAALDIIFAVDGMTDPLAFAERLEPVLG